ncbi:MAG TPA: prolyl oligopeptidase family serine peptidase [Caulobacterales bacterium]|nr:prolyl oligopeptidase family serine peptidase [Caulobacterales bacterium]
MRTFVLLAASLCALGCATPHARTAAAPSLENVQSVAIPEYGSERGIEWTGSREDYVAAQTDQRFVLEQFTYQSDGLTVGAYLYRPRVRPAHRLPVIVFNRGSITWPHGFVGQILIPLHRYAEAGYIVVAPQYRGSNGWQGRDEAGGADLHDLMNIVPQIGRIPGADPTHLYLAGESRGGAMVFMALRDGFPARAAAEWGGFTDLGPLIAEGGPQARYAPMLWPDLDQRREEVVSSRSVMFWADKINAPVLIMHGGADEDIPAEQSRQLDAELTRLGKVHQFLVFDGEQHVIGGKGAERDAAVVAWFRRFQ